MEPAACPGFEHFTIKPYPVEGLTWLEASLKTKFGVIEVKWKNHDGRFEIEGFVPQNSTATLILPDNSVLELKEGNYQHSQ